MAPMDSKELRDAVHGLVDLTDHEWKVVDSPAFQWLRGVQQLSLTHGVYPGARHRRVMLTSGLSLRIRDYPKQAACISL
jgi:hypothetical protein